jgi:hypothetical protein
MQKRYASIGVANFSWYTDAYLSGRNSRRLPDDQVHLLTTDTAKPSHEPQDLVYFGKRFANTRARADKEFNENGNRPEFVSAFP